MTDLMDCTIIKYYCSTCHYNAQTTFNLNAHYKTKKHELCVKNSFLQTDQFHKEINTLKEVIQHIIEKYKRFHLINSNYFTFENILKSHINVDGPMLFTKTENDEYYVCNGCNKNFKERSNYKQHMHECAQLGLRHNLLKEVSIHLMIQLKQLQEACNIEEPVPRSRTSAKDKIIQELRDKIKSLNEQNSKEVENKTIMLCEQNDKIQRKVIKFDSKCRKLMEAKANILVLTKQNNYLESMTHTLTTENKVLEQEISLLKERNNELNIVNKVLEQRVPLLEEKISLLNERGIELNIQNKVLEERYKALESNNKVLEERCKGIEQHNNLVNNLGNIYNTDNRRTTFKFVMGNNPVFEYVNPFINKETDMPFGADLPEEKRILADNHNQPKEIKQQLCSGHAFLDSYNAKKLLEFVVKGIVCCYAKQNVNERSIWSSDTTRNTYRIHIKENGSKNEWRLDKGGDKLREILIKPVLQYIYDSMNKYKQYYTQKHLGNLKEFKYPMAEEMNILYKKFVNEDPLDLSDNDIYKFNMLFATINDLQNCVADQGFGTKILKKMASRFYIDRNKCLALCKSEEEKKIVLKELEEIELMEKSEEVRERQIQELCDSDSEYSEIHELTDASESSQDELTRSKQDLRFYGSVESEYDTSGDEEVVVPVIKKPITKKLNPSTKVLKSCTGRSGNNKSPQKANKQTLAKTVNINNKPKTNTAKKISNVTITKK
jgi:hypothetical protein